MARDLIGETLLNQFRVDSFLAAGGMAAIYRVWDLQRNVPLAMKVLHPELAGDPAFIARFQREASSLQRLVHPHIVPFYGLYRAGSLTFLLERFIDGPSLEEVLRKRGGGALPMIDALVYFKAIATSLGYAHAQGIIHCDVKPGNVLVDQGGSVYLSDFGIARFAGSVVTATSAMGTPLYMAPEQIRGEAATPQTDIYALGGLLFELLTGRRPFNGEEPIAGFQSGSQVERIRYQQLYQPPPDPRQLNPLIPEALAQAVLKALAKDPRERYASVIAMVEQVSRGIGARFDTLPDRVRLSQELPTVIPWRGEAAPVEQGAPVEPGGGGDSPLGQEQPPSFEDVLHQAPPVYPEGALEPRWRSRKVILIAAGLVLLCLFLLGAALLGRTLWAGLLPAIRGKPSAPPAAQTITPGLKATLPAATAPAQPSATAAAPGAGQPQGQIALVQKTKGKDALFLFDLGTGDLSALPEPPVNAAAQSQAPQWSPDGASLAWMSRYSGKGHILVANVAAGVVRVLSAGEGYAQVSSPSWTAGGKLIFWARGKGGSVLVTADPGTGASLDEAALPDYRNLFVSNPASGTLAFAHMNGDRYEVAIGSSAGAIGMVVETGGEEYAPAWSPDGQWLAFQSDAGRTAGENEIWVARADGSEPRQVTSSPAGSWSRAPTWSPDGRWIAFVSSQAGSLGADYGELFAVEVASGKTLRLTQTGGAIYDWRPAWRP